MSRLSEPSDPDLPTIEGKVQSADDYACNRQNSCRDVRIDQLIQVMEQEPTLVWLDSGFAFEPVLQNRQRTRPRKQFRENSRDKRSEMQPAENRTPTSQQSAKGYPQDEHGMQQKDGNRERGIECRPKNGCMHS